MNMDFGQLTTTKEDQLNYENDYQIIQHAQLMFNQILKLNYFGEPLRRMETSNLYPSEFFDILKVQKLEPEMINYFKAVIDTLAHSIGIDKEKLMKSEDIRSIIDSVVKSGDNYEYLRELKNLASNLVHK